MVYNFQQGVMAGAAAGGGGYTIDQSIRFNDNDSARLEKTYSSSESILNVWSFSTWVKRANLGTEQWIFQAGTSASLLEYIRFQSTDKIELKLTTGAGDDYNYITSALYRDPGAWLHIFVVRNTTAISLYVNGTQVTSFSTTNAPSTLNGAFGANVRHRIGADYSTPANFLDAYLAEMHFVPGLAKSVSDFGKVNADTGQWVPIAYTGSYGTNGFYITGENSAALGTDYSGNNNDFTSSGLTSADQVSDTPTLNFPVISPIDRQSGAAATISDGNLKFTNGNTGTSVDARATFALPKGQGKWYFEMEADILGQSGINREFIGIVSTEWRIDSGTGGQAFYMDPNGFSFSTAGSKGNNNSLTSYGSAWSAGDIIGCAVDLDNNKIWWSINNTWQNSGDPAAGTNAAFTTLSSDVTYAPAFAVDYGTGTSQIIANFGQTGGLTYTPPTDFKALSTANLPDPAIALPTDHFNTLLYAGSSSVQSVTGVGFSPDMLWIKNRSAVASHTLFDKIRGAGATLYPDLTNPEDVNTTKMQSFDSDGFTLGGGYSEVNTSGNNFVSWNWYTGGGTGSSNTDGSITSTVSVNTTAGFSIATYTGTGSAATIGHGLGVAPDFILVKKRVVGTDDAWIIWHQGLPGPNYYLNFDTGAQDTSVNYWNNTLPTSSVFSVGASNGTNQSTKTFVAYLWNEVEGFSKFGSYTGNGSTDGPFVYCGFTPRWILIKSTGVESWPMLDTARGSGNFGSAAGSTGDNPTAGNDLNAVLVASTSAAEEDNPAGSRRASFVSNGFKVRTTNSAMNTSSQKYVFAAFAESPFKYANAR